MGRGRRFQFCVSISLIVVIIIVRMTATDKQLGKPPSTPTIAKIVHQSYPSSTNSSKASEVDTVYENRIRQLHEYCENVKPRNLHRPSRFSLMTRINNHTVGYCLIPKAASTTISLLMLVGTGSLTNISEVNNERLRQGDERMTPACKNIDKCLITYRNGLLQGFKTDFNFIFTREPMGRLLSAWADKINRREDRQYFYEKVNKKIFLQKGVLFPPMSSMEAWDTGLRVSFEDFLSWVSKRKNAYSDEHWSPMVFDCEPCATSYNLVGHLETFSKDIKHVKEKLGIKLSETDFQIGLKNVNKHAAIKEQHIHTLETYMKKVDYSVKKELYQIYKHDYEAFSYEVPKYLKS